MNPGDNRRYAPSTSRNRDPILEILRRVLPARGTVLEVSSGSGEHAVYFAEALPGLVWQPSELLPDLRASIEGWIAHSGVKNVPPPLALDVRTPVWPLSQADAVVNINMIHIAPWEACQGLLRGACRLLSPGGLLYLYGPFKVGGAHTAPSNEAFDQSLRARDPSFGVRDLDAVTALAAEHGLLRAEVVEMPANNLSVILRRVGAASADLSSQQ